MCSSDLNPYELNVFVSALNEVVDGDKTVSDILAENGHNMNELLTDELVSVVAENFQREMDKQTNFNSVGDYTDSQPELRQARQTIFKTIEKRGRKPSKGSSSSD